MGIFPEKLKVAKVIPLFKKGVPTIINNYRPISLLPAISKVLEKIMGNQLSSYFESKKLFSKNQYGFRSGHSTEFAALELIDRITTKLDNNEVPFSIFLDLSKAFDTLDHNTLLCKLNHDGIQRISLKLYESYLSNRTQYVEFADVKSETLSIATGVPQGSILGTILFIMYINDFSHACQIFNFISCADDTTLLSTMSNFTNAHNDDADILINEEQN